jgi:hypothetical protein
MHQKSRRREAWRTFFPLSRPASLMQVKFGETACTTRKRSAGLTATTRRTLAVTAIRRCIMCYKTIVVHVDHSLHAEARIRYAAQLAARCGAHLVGSAFSGISRYAEAGSTMLLAQQHEHRGDHDTALARFDAIAAAEGVVSHERRYADDDPAGGLALQGRYADLVIVSQTNLDDPAAAHLAGPVPAQVVQGSARPAGASPYTPARDDRRAHHAGMGRQPAGNTRRRRRHAAAARCRPGGNRAVPTA